MSIGRSAREIATRRDWNPGCPGVFSEMHQTPRRWTTRLGQAASHPAAFIVVSLYAAGWLIFSPRTFDWNAGATLAVWVMTLFIQRSEHRDTEALHAKLDELLRTSERARNEFTNVDEEEPEEIERIRDQERDGGGAPLGRPAPPHQPPGRPLSGKPVGQPGE
jgi:low affinity Fe/Cu permease